MAEATFCPFCVLRRAAAPLCKRNEYSDVPWDCVFGNGLFESIKGDRGYQIG